jgi:hypothetical protein
MSSTPFTQHTKFILGCLLFIILAIGTISLNLIFTPIPSDAKCIGGFLFMVEPDGEVRPAADHEHIAVKCGP